MFHERVGGGEGLVGTAGAGSLDVMGKTASHSWLLFLVGPGEGENLPQSQRSSSNLEIPQRGLQRAVNRSLLGKV